MPSSLVQSIERIFAGQPADADALPPHFESAGAADRFLAHHAAATLAMRAAREHLLDAFRAIDAGDRHVLGQFLAVSKLLGIADDVARPISDFGLAAIERGRWPVGLDALAHAARLDETAGDGSLAADADRCAEIADRYARAARTLGRRVSKPSNRLAGPPRIAVIASELTDGSAVAQLLDGWVRHADGSDDLRLRVYTTEAHAAATRQSFGGATPTPGSVRGGVETIGRLKAAGVDVWHAPADADAIQTSRMLTERLVRDAVDLLFVDASLADAAAWMTVAMRPVERQIALLRPGRAVGIEGLDSVVDLDEPLWRGDRAAWAERGIACQSIFQGVEVADDAVVERKQYGIAPDAVVMMTISRDPARTITPAFARTVARALAESPRSCYLIVGPGACPQQRQIFEAAGVAKRVGYAGQRRDLAGFVAMSDVYVAETPSSDREGVLTAMAVGRPVVILAGDADRPGHARFVGAPHAVVGNLQTMLDRLVKLLADPTRRAEVGEAMAARARDRFSMSTTVARLRELAVEQVAGKSATAVESALKELSKVA